MRISKTTTAITLGLALALGACNGGGDAEDEEATEETEEANDSADHAADGYASDATGGFAAEISPEGLAPLNAQLAQIHADTGRDIHVSLVGSTEGTDIAQAASLSMDGSDADGFILVAAGDEAIGIVGEGIDEGEADPIIAAMVEAFDEENFLDGFNAGIAATSEAMGN